ncbi:MAG: T9SS type A sorting domain-containing protein [candidate division KSB1 bacterium]|nr:T9SS type A sorting domain-containing protein [candidate division KSB1 bacterium]MDZ7340866.1 T9SS type A sorting domain-containing protein [candidate division KSB1 bacterium]
MWLGTWAAGLSKLDTNGVFTNYWNSTDSLVFIDDIEFDSMNNIWISYDQWYGKTRYGAYIVHFNDSITIYYDVNIGMASPICLGQDSLGQIWCGMSDYGLACWFDGSQWQPYGVIGTGVYSEVNEIKTDRRGKLYFAHSWGLSTLTNVIIYLHSPVWDLAFDKQNRIWLATNSDWWGLMMFDGRNFYAHTTEEGLLSNYLMAVAVDSNNNVWVSYSSKRGVSKFDGAKFGHFNHNDGLADDLVYNIFVDKYGNIWFATLKGVSVLHDTTKTDVEFKKDFYPPKAFSLFYNYPNPFNMTTLIKYDLIFLGQIELIIYNLAGEEVIKLINEHQSPGAYQVVWDSKDNHGKEVSSGIYIAVLKCGNLKKSIKLSLIR